MASKESALKEFEDEIRDCQRCALSGTRTQVVFGTGSPEAEIVFVGEAPGYHEDLQGTPFVGAAGQYLDQLLAGIGLGRSQVYIANVLKCRPPDNRDPTGEEVETCKPFLFRQLEIMRPRVVCPLGNFAAQTILGKKEGITKLRGKHYQVGGFLVWPMYHPAAALHQGNLRQRVEEDFQQLRKFLAKNLQPEPQVEQIDLF